MKAIQIKQTGGPEVLEYVDLPAPTAKANEAVVKTTAIGVNFIDVYNREGRYKVPLPFVPGQEAAGIVEAVGKDVTTLKPGPVIGLPMRACLVRMLNTRASPRTAWSRFLTE